MTFPQTQYSLSSHSAVQAQISVFLNATVTLCILEPKVRNLHKPAKTFLRDVSVIRRLTAQLTHTSVTLTQLCGSPALRFCTQSLMENQSSMKSLIPLVHPERAGCCFNASSGQENEIYAFELNALVFNTRFFTSVLSKKIGKRIPRSFSWCFPIKLCCDVK